MVKTGKIQTYHEWTITILFLLSASMCLTSQVIPVPLTILLVAVALICRIKRLSRLLGPALKTFLSLLVIVFCTGIGIWIYKDVKDIVFLFGPFFLAWLCSAFAFRNQKGLDWQVALSSIMLAITAVIGGAGVGDHFFFILFCTCYIFYLNATYFYEREPSENLPKGYFGPFLLCLISGWGVGIMIFVFFPRTVQWSNPFGLRDRQSTTGYSGGLNLAGNGPSPSSNLALLVEPSSPHDRQWLEQAGPDMYFRGNTVDQFDGERWVASAAAAGGFRTMPQHRAEGEIRSVKIYREPHAPSWLILPGTPVGLDYPEKVIGNILMDEAGNVFRPVRGFIRYSYTVDFDDSPIFKIRRRQVLYPKEQENYLSIPKEIKNSEFFNKWLASLPFDAKKKNLSELLSSFHGYFQKNYKSRLDIKAISLENFLTESREGFCEYFATAATLALRSWGYPARIVLGFRGGRFNPVAQVLEVRDENAHAWTEIFVDDVGWIRFDPTPLTKKVYFWSFLDEITVWTGAAKYWFSVYIVDYNSATQKELLTDLAKSNLTKSVFQVRKLKVKPYYPLLLVLLVIPFFFIRQKKYFGFAESKLPRYYIKFQKQLRRLGIERNSDETFRHFHARIHHPKVNPNELVEIDKRLERDLYASL